MLRCAVHDPGQQPSSQTSNLIELMTHRTAFHAALLALAFCLVLPVTAATPAPARGTAIASQDAWPRTLNIASGALRVYPPQVTQWVDSRITFRMALALKPTTGGDEAFGIVFATARTHVDKVTRTVVLDDVALTRSDFPMLADHGASLVPQLATPLATGVRNIALDRLTLSLAASGAASRPVDVDNDPPRVIVSTVPAILVPVDGAPVLQPVAGGNGVQRVVNTRALILKSPAAPEFFLHVYDGWLMARSLDGPWEQPFLAPAGLDALATTLAARGAVDLLDGGRRANPKPSLANGIPAIYTTQMPAELVVFNGAPDLVPIVGTGLLWASNSASDVLRDAASGTYYVLLAGRWFRAGALSGPWTFVASNALPAGFARIPSTSRAGAVLATVAGTAEAREAAIENSIPQTATVPLKNGLAFQAVYDGSPQFVPIAGTSLAFARNAAVPVLQTGAASYHAITAGIWFTATAPNGPWAVATSVPESVYTIPPSSPMFYVTFARIYGATADAVFEGYTPGYLGAVVTPTGNVVFGTGHAYAPWIGRAWYPGPTTYGVAATPVYNRYVGHTYAFAMGLATAAWAQVNGGASLHPGYWGGYPCCGSASANVYRYWARNAGAKMRATPSSARSTTAVATAARNQATAGAPLPAAAAIQHASAANRGYDMTMVTNADSGYPYNAPRDPNAPTAGPITISANAYYASLRNGGGTSGAASNNVYADPDGNLYRHDGRAWQRHANAGWTDAPAAPDWADAQVQSRDRAAKTGAQAGAQAGSYGMSNATRFTGNRGDGWTRRDAGDGGYSRTLGGDGGISAEYNAYNDAVLNNAFDIAANGGWWGDGFYVGGIGWGGRYGPVVAP
jgi:hypothetical protein